jgi:uncharacterized membrane protein
VAGTPTYDIKHFISYIYHFIYWRVGCSLAGIVGEVVGLLACSVEGLFLVFNTLYDKDHGSLGKAKARQSSRHRRSLGGLTN